MISTEQPLLDNLYPQVLYTPIPHWPNGSEHGGGLVNISKSSSLLLPHSLLHPNEFVVWDSYKLEKRRTEFLAGRVAAKLACQDLRQKCGLAQAIASTVEISNHTDGRPYINSCSDLPQNTTISISHSGIYGAALVSSYPCGIDIQQRQSKMAKLRSRFCLPGEEQILDALLPAASTLDILNILWASKEAIRKATAADKMIGFMEMKADSGSIIQPGTACLHFAATQSGRDLYLPVLATVIDESYALAVSFLCGDSHA